MPDSCCVSSPPATFFDPALTYSADALLGTDTFTGSLARDAGENAGTHAITRGTLALSSNYTLNFSGADLTINPKVAASEAAPEKD